jgi:23S rRNA pseudouridine955/2504/2580 synthase
MRVGRNLQQQVQILRVDADQSGRRLDNFLMSLLKDVPKSHIYRLLRKGEVRVNKGRKGPDYKLREDDLVRVPPLRMSSPTQAKLGSGLASLLRKSILYQEEDCVILNKPSGLAVHGGSGIKMGLIEALRSMWPEERHLGLVHRLDRDTSGCLIIARSNASLRNLHEQIREGLFDKRYLAMVKGQWPKDISEINAPLRSNTLSSGERIVVVNKEGKQAITRVNVIQNYPGASLVEAKLETGRMHQIRVHCQFTGHNVAGDPKYGDDEFNKTQKDVGLHRMFLHASTIEFRSPITGKKISVSAPLPEDLQLYLSAL